MTIKQFLNERLPLGEFSAHLRKPLPKHINLLFSLGSLAMFLLLLQAATGAFLAFYYSPSPEHAHNAVTYISTEVPFGAFVRGLHHWGASAMVIIVVLHLLRVVLYSSYKAPRELTWIFGVLLLLIVLGFGFTGYLLPWDEKAYWATVVGVEIASTAPGLGDFVAKVMRGGAEIGAVTLSRFYALHTIWLPWLAFGLVGVHLFFVRYYGSSGTPKNTPEEMKTGKPFYPHQVFEDVVGMLILFVILAAVAIFVPVPLEDVADPTNADYDPRPEWYFLFLFQLLKYFQGPFEIIGTFVIPTVGMLLLLFLPFLDRSERVVLWKRPIALTVTSVSVIAIVVLTILGGASKKLETTDAAVQETSQPTEQIQEATTPDTETEEVEAGEDVFDFQLTEEEIEGAKEVEEEPQ
ncbi:cytochrome bc complex cytochrome b subunit [Candidatus Poribacteria bacterium]|nr:cytochrome bc complex cytochrome b subunit [Candidatus Poribacteria bacterium]